MPIGIVRSAFECFSARISIPVNSSEPPARQRPVADIVQCGLDNRKVLRSNRLTDTSLVHACKLLIFKALLGWLARLDSN